MLKGEGEETFWIINSTEKKMNRGGYKKLNPQEGICRDHALKNPTKNAFPEGLSGNLVGRRGQ